MPLTEKFDALDKQYLENSSEEKTKPPVYVHIGFHKTGTTYIQLLLEANRAALGNFHVINQRDQNSSATRTACQKLLGHPDSNLDEVASGVIDACRDIDAAAGNKPIFVSDEEFFGFIPGRHGYWKLYDRAHVIMKAIAAGFPGREVKFFAYTRSLFPWLISVHTEAAKNHHLQLSLEDFLKNLSFRGDLISRSDEMRAAVPNSSFTTMDMKADKHQPFGLGYSLFKWAGVSDAQMESLVRPGPGNESVPTDIKEVFLTLNRHGFRGDKLMHIKNTILGSLSA